METTPHAEPVTRRWQQTAHVSCIYRLVEEACNNGNLAVIDEAIGPAPSLDEQTPAEAPAPQRLRQLLAAFRAAVPDARWTVEEQITEGDTVATRLSISGTFHGGLLGLAPPGRPATVTGVVISHFADGRIVDLWLQADLLGLLQQLGVMPALELTQAVAMAQVVRAGTLIAGGFGQP